jgi:hypothetical protein
MPQVIHMEASSSSGWSSWTATKPCGISARSQVWRSRLHCTLFLSERRISDETIPWYCTS